MASGGPSAAIVTGEAVALDLQPATFASRAVSGVIDLIVQGVGLVAVDHVDLDVDLVPQDFPPAAVVDQAVDRSKGI